MRLVDLYREMLHVTDEALVDELVRVSEFRALKAGEQLIGQGKLPSHVYFLLEGVLRGFIIDINGKDLTDCIIFRFGEPAMPDNDVTRPASITVEALTDCELVCVPIDQVQRLLHTYPSAMEIYLGLILAAASVHRELKIAIYQYTAMQRYQWFLSAYPGLIDRVSHKYIASLLNMTPVTLSKIRRAIKESGR